MSNKKPKTTSTRNRGGRRRRGGRNRQLIALKLAAAGHVWDTNLNTNELYAKWEKVRMRLPPMNFNGPVNSDVEAMTMAMASRGIAPNDTIEVIDMLEGHGVSISIYSVPDFDPASENKNEKQMMGMAGYGKLYAAAQKSRSEISRLDARELKKRNQWGGW